MKLKKILKQVKKMRKIDDEFALRYRETHYDKTVGVMFQAYLDAVLSNIVGIDYNEWCDKVGNAKAENGAFIVDELYTAILYGDLKPREVKKLVDLGWDEIYTDAHRKWVEQEESR